MNKCNSCNSVTTVKYGKRKCGSVINQRYKCMSCGKTYTDRNKKFLRKHTHDDIITEAIRLARHGYSFRYIQKKLPVNVSHQTIKNWFMTYKIKS